MTRSKALRILLAIVTLPICLAGCGVSRMVNVDSVNVGETPKKVKLDYSRDSSARKILQINHKYYKPGFQTWTVEEVPQTWNIELKAE